MWRRSLRWRRLSSRGAWQIPSSTVRPDRARHPRRYICSEHTRETLSPPPGWTGAWDMGSSQWVEQLRHGWDVSVRSAPPNTPNIDRYRLDAHLSWRSHVVAVVVSHWLGVSDSRTAVEWCCARLRGNEIDVLQTIDTWRILWRGCLDGSVSIAQIGTLLFHLRGQVSIAGTAVLPPPATKALWSPESPDGTSRRTAYFQALDEARESVPAGSTGVAALDRQLQWVSAVVADVEVLLHSESRTASAWHTARSLLQMLRWHLGPLRPRPTTAERRAWTRLVQRGMARQPGALLDVQSVLADDIVGFGPNVARRWLAGDLAFSPERGGIWAQREQGDGGRKSKSCNGNYAPWEVGSCLAGDRALARSRNRMLADRWSQFQLEAHNQRRDVTGARPRQDATFLVWNCWAENGLLWESVLDHGALRRAPTPDPSIPALSCSYRLTAKDSPAEWVSHVSHIGRIAADAVSHRWEVARQVREVADDAVSGGGGGCSMGDDKMAAIAALVAEWDTASGARVGGLAPAERSLETAAAFARHIPRAPGSHQWAMRQRDAQWFARAVKRPVLPGRSMRQAQATLAGIGSERAVQVAGKLLRNSDVLVMAKPALFWKQVGGHSAASQSAKYDDPFPWEREDVRWTDRDDALADSSMPPNVRTLVSPTSDAPTPPLVQGTQLYQWLLPWAMARRVTCLPDLLRHGSIPRSDTEWDECVQRIIGAFVWRAVGDEAGKLAMHGGPDSLRGVLETLVALQRDGWVTAEQAVLVVLHVWRRHPPNGLSDRGWMDWLERVAPEGAVSDEVTRLSMDLLGRAAPQGAPDARPRLQSMQAQQSLSAAVPSQSNDTQVQRSLPLRAAWRQWLNSGAAPVSQHRRAVWSLVRELDRAVRIDSREMRNVNVRLDTQEDAVAAAFSQARTRRRLRAVAHQLRLFAGAGDRERKQLEIDAMQRYLRRGDALSCLEALLSGTTCSSSDQMDTSGLDEALPERIARFAGWLQATTPPLDEGDAPGHSATIDRRLRSDPLVLSGMARAMWFHWRSRVPEDDSEHSPTSSWLAGVMVDPLQRLVRWSGCDPTKDSAPVEALLEAAATTVEEHVTLNALLASGWRVGPAGWARLVKRRGWRGALSEAEEIVQRVEEFHRAGGDSGRVGRAELVTVRSAFLTALHASQSDARDTLTVANTWFQKDDLVVAATIIPDVPLATPHEPTQRDSQDRATIAERVIAVALSSAASLRDWPMVQQWLRAAQTTCGYVPPLCCVEIARKALESSPISWPTVASVWRELARQGPFVRKAKTGDSMATRAHASVLLRLCLKAPHLSRGGGGMLRVRAWLAQAGVRHASGSFLDCGWLEAECRWGLRVARDGSRSLAQECPPMAWEDTLRWAKQSVGRMDDGAARAAFRRRLGTILCLWARQIAVPLSSPSGWLVDEPVDPAATKRAIRRILTTVAWVSEDGTELTPLMRLLWGQAKIAAALLEGDADAVLRVVDAVEETWRQSTVPSFAWPVLARAREDIRQKDFA